MSDDQIQAALNQARKNAEDTLAANEAARRQKRQEVADMVASIYEDAAAIALAGIEQGLDSATCYGISSALKIQALIVRGDTQ